jgi:hypothetical protein
MQGCTCWAAAQQFAQLTWWASNGCRCICHGGHNVVAAAARNHPIRHAIVNPTGATARATSQCTSDAAITGSLQQHPLGQGMEALLTVLGASCVSLPSCPCCCWGKQQQQRYEREIPLIPLHHTVTARRLFTFTISLRSMTCQRLQEVTTGDMAGQISFSFAVEKHEILDSALSVRCGGKQTTAQLTAISSWCVIVRIVYVQSRYDTNQLSINKVS